MYYNLDKFGNELRALRKLLNLTQKDVCEITCLNEDSIRKIENGKVIPKQETLDLLSVAFKKDITYLFLCCRIDEHESYQKITEALEVHLESGDYDLLVIDLNELQCLLNGKMNIYYKNSINQTIAMTESLIAKNIDHDLHKSYNLMINALLISNPQFAIENFYLFSYSKLELQILMNLGVLIGKMNSLQISLPILKFCSEQLEKESMLINSKLAIKIYFNLSYAYHRADDHQNALICADKGIAINLQNRSLYALGLLYVRKGIAQFNLQDIQGRETLIKAFDFFKLSNQEHHVAQLRKTLKDAYQLDI